MDHAADNRAAQVAYQKANGDTRVADGLMFLELHGHSQAAAAIRQLRERAVQAEAERDVFRCTHKPDCACAFCKRDAALAEIESLRAENTGLQEEVQEWRSKAWDEDSLRAEVARLREALNAAGDIAARQLAEPSDVADETRTLVAICDVVDAALAGTQEEK